MNAAHFLNYYNFQTYLAAIWFNTHWLTSHPLLLLQNISMWNAQWLGGMLAINRVNDKKVNLSKKTESHGVLLGYYIPLFSERSSICFCIFPFAACLDSGQVMAPLFFQSLFSFLASSLFPCFLSTVLALSLGRTQEFAVYMYDTNMIHPNSTQIQYSPITEQQQSVHIRNRDTVCEWRLTSKWHLSCDFHKNKIRQKMEDIYNYNIEDAGLTWAVCWDKTCAAA